MYAALVRTAAKAVLAMTILQDWIELLIWYIRCEAIIDISGHVLDALNGVIKTFESFVSGELIHRTELQKDFLLAFIIADSFIAIHPLILQFLIHFWTLRSLRGDSSERSSACTEQAGCLRVVFALRTPLTSPNFLVATLDHIIHFVLDIAHVANRFTSGKSDLDSGSHLRLIIYCELFGDSLLDLLVAQVFLYL